MELNEVKSIWQAYDSKLDKSLKLNLHCLGLIQTQKVKSQLDPILWQRTIELVFHATAIALLLVFLANNFFHWLYAISAISLLIFYTVAFYNCVKQIVIVKRMDYSNDIVTIQNSLVLLRTHMVNFGRLTILCIPTFLAYPMVVSKAIADLNLKGLAFMDIRAGYHGNWWTIQLASSIILIPICVWLYKQLSYKNMHVNWVSKTIQTFGGKRIKKSIEFINELEFLRKGVN